MNRLRQLETFARTGWFARGVVYSLFGYFALTSRTVSKDGAQGVFRQINDIPGGSALLALLAFGLALYGAYRLYGAALDSEGKGTEAKAVAIRVGYAASGLAHFAMAWLAVKLLVAGHVEGGRESAAAGAVLDLPMGNALLGAAGVGFAVAAVHQAIKAWRAGFMDGIDPGAPRWVKPVGRAGIAARAFVFAIVAFSLLRAGWFDRANEVMGLGDVAAGLAAHPWLSALVALGLLLFGVFSFVEARWRRIRDEDVVARLRAATR